MRENQENIEVFFVLLNHKEIWYNFFKKSRKCWKENIHFLIEMYVLGEK